MAPAQSTLAYVGGKLELAPSTAASESLTNYSHYREGHMVHAAMPEAVPFSGHNIEPALQPQPAPPLQQPPSFVAFIDHIGGFEQAAAAGDFEQAAAEQPLADTDVGEDSEDDSPPRTPAHAPSPAHPASQAEMPPTYDFNAPDSTGKQEHPVDVEKVRGNSSVLPMIID